MDKRLAEELAKSGCKNNCLFVFAETNDLLLKRRPKCPL
jgi:hypothetical protein